MFRIINYTMTPMSPNTIQNDNSAVSTPPLSRGLNAKPPISLSS